MPLVVGQILENRYRIDARLGQGGMGAVYRATDLRLDVTVAIKENLEVTPEAQSQFEREALILAKLDHPNLPRVTDHFFIPGQGQYLVMQYIAGEDLGQIVARSGALDEPQALAWIDQVLRALEYLHARGIIHRDIKPANIKICPDPDSPNGDRVYLVDFGLAKTYDPLLSTTTGARGATPGYAPLEQYGGMGRTDARTDVYSVGATLYAMVTGQRPSDSRDIGAGQAELLPPRQLTPSVSRAVEAGILRAMQPRMADRFQSAAEFRAALTPPLPSPAPDTTTPSPRPAPLPVTTTPSPRPAPPLVWLRSRRIAVAAIAVLVVLVSLVGLVLVRPLLGGSATSTPTDTPTSTPTLIRTLTTAATLTPTTAATGAPWPTATLAPTSTDMPTATLTPTPASGSTLPSTVMPMASMTSQPRPPKTTHSPGSQPSHQH